MVRVALAAMLAWFAVRISAAQAASAETFSPAGTPSSPSADYFPIRAPLDSEDRASGARVLAPRDTRRTQCLRGDPVAVLQDGSVVAVAATEAVVTPAVIYVSGREGQVVYQRWLRGPVTPVVSPDGSFLACGSTEGLLVIDLRTFTESLSPRSATGSGRLEASTSQTGSPKSTL
jgi:hypothetical protein